MRTPWATDRVDYASTGKCSPAIKACRAALSGNGATAVCVAQPPLVKASLHMEGILATSPTMVILGWLGFCCRTAPRLCDWRNTKKSCTQGTSHLETWQQESSM